MSFDPVIEAPDAGAAAGAAVRCGSSAKIGFGALELAFCVEGVAIAQKQHLRM